VRAVEAVRSLASDTAPGAQPSGPGGALIPLAAVEENYLHRSVATFPGDRKALARALGISERALYRKLARLGAGDPGL
jgi:two-component system response regulator HydG